MIDARIIFGNGTVVRPIIKYILEGALLECDALTDYQHPYGWSLQGFGMLRLHINDALRLNVWDKEFRVPYVSLVHDHPWNFASLVVSGELRNTRFNVYDSRDDCGNLSHVRLNKPDSGGGIMAGPMNADALVMLEACPTERIGEGAWYRQFKDEVHLSDPSDGTVTLNYRERVGEDYARVFWPHGQQWVSAEPRPATAIEVKTIIKRALDRWRK